MKPLRECEHACPIETILRCKHDGHAGKLARVAGA
jgi:hypothetical protein